MKRIIFLLTTMLICGSINAQEQHYTFNYHNFEHQMTAIIQVNIDGIEQTSSDIELGAFNGENVTGSERIGEYGSAGYHRVYLAIYFNEAYDVTFKIYNHQTGEELDNCSVTFENEPFTMACVPDAAYGLRKNPVVLNFTTSTTSSLTKDILGYEGEGGYYLIASPVGEVNPTNVTNMLESSYDLYWFKQDGDEQGKEWMNYKAESFDLVPGKGYLYANSQDVTLSFPGNAYEGTTLEVPLDYVADCNFPGMNLVGNPFNATAYIGGRDFYVMDNDDIVPAETDEIAPMEGVFVCADAEGESVTFSTTNGKKTSRLALNLVSSSKLVDRAIVNFSEGQLPKFQLNANSTKLYFPMSDKDYAVVSCQDMGELPLSFKAEKSGSYTLAVNCQDVSFAYLHLIDNLNGSDTDLLANPSYSFEASTTDYASRFKLVFATGNNASDEFAFFSNGAFVINNEGNATLQVVDVTGRIIMSESINGCVNVSINQASGLYMLRLVNGDSVKVQKVVVR